MKPEFAIGWFGRATEEGHNSKHTQTHVFKLDKKICVCGYRPHETMQFQWCSYGTTPSNYIECKKCLERAKKMWVKSLIAKGYQIIQYRDLRTLNNVETLHYEKDVLYVKFKTK